MAIVLRKDGKLRSRKVAAAMNMNAEDNDVQISPCFVEVKNAHISQTESAREAT